MRPTTLFATLVTACVVESAPAQGTFVYDQQSADEAHLAEGDVGLGDQPLGQSFTPTFSSVGFIRIFLSGGMFGNATVHINLRADSITGTILGSTSPVIVTVATQGFVDFFFADPVAVTPGTTYYFQPVNQTGGGWGANVSDFYRYPGGTAFGNGVPSLTRDFWFREGIVVPEPSAVALIFIGGGLLLYVRRIHNQCHSGN